ncbi:MAG TPA: ABC transporter substrate-binding protein, partial [Pseudomonas sp.]|nr:ABC transporter substrate-binding protein [Pseudomonas sp.]
LGSLWTSVGGPLAALQVIEDAERLLGKADAEPVTRD